MSLSFLRCRRCYFIRSLDLLKLGYIFFLMGCTQILFGQSTNEHSSTNRISINKEAEFLSPQTLNSERIRMKFGTYGVKVLYADSLCRISSLFSIESGEPLTRTLAVTSFRVDIDSLLWPLHQKIIAGGSIGEVFKAAGWTVEKSAHVIGSTDSIFTAQFFPWQDTELLYGCYHLYQFWGRKETLRLPYAEILELHHPDFLTLEELRKIFPAAVQDSSEVVFFQNCVPNPAQKMTD
jgi:hypothetical protein